MRLGGWKESLGGNCTWVSLFHKYSSRDQIPQPIIEIYGSISVFSLFSINIMVLNLNDPPRPLVEHIQQYSAFEALFCNMTVQPCHEERNLATPMTGRLNLIIGSRLHFHVRWFIIGRVHAFYKSLNFTSESQQSNTQREIGRVHTILEISIYIIDGYFREETH